MQQHQPPEQFRQLVLVISQKTPGFTTCGPILADAMGESKPEETGVPPAEGSAI